jgi:hypothetical protein
MGAVQQYPGQSWKWPKCPNTISLVAIFLPTKKAESSFLEQQR